MTTDYKLYKFLRKKIIDLIPDWSTEFTELLGLPSEYQTVNERIFELIRIGLSRLYMEVETPHTETDKIIIKVRQSIKTENYAKRRLLRKLRKQGVCDTEINRQLTELYGDCNEYWLDCKEKTWWN